MDYFKILAIVSPFISASLTALFAYNFTMKAKRFDLLHQSKIPAFKELSVTLINYKNYCLGQVANYEGNEFSPYSEETGGTLHHRTEIAQTASMNVIYFSIKTRKKLDDLLNEMSLHCNMELYIASGQDVGNQKESYFNMAEIAENCINELYTELNLKP
ncbi:hypothetical protein D3C87_362980 [compost metagenome]